jgi:hypothetical protein
MMSIIGLGRELQGMGLITQVKKGEKIVPINLRRQSDEEVD